MPDIHQILQEYWGYPSFRPLQEDIIRSALEGHDTLGLLPTGGGKSITFQVPALALGGLCLVVTPLISLMKDQTDHLVRRGIKAAYLHMGMSHEEIVETYDRISDQHYNFLYLSPERLSSPLFQARLFYMDVRLVVIDEAHCISQWGYDFRPSYLKIAELRTLLRRKDIPFMALTATATQRTVDDIAARLEFRPGYQVFRATFVRPNLTYRVQFVDQKEKVDAAIALLRDVECGIIYVRSREGTEAAAQQLKQAGIEAEAYHAGLSPLVRQRRQEAWIQGTTRVVVATNAFGMGIDKPNVRCVVHLGPSPSPEEYFQEAGRAGRDGKPAEAVLLAEPGDLKRLRRNVDREFPEREYVRYVYERLGSLFQVAVGAGQDATFDFIDWSFCQSFHLAPAPTYYALNILEQAGYIRQRTEAESFSSMRMMVPRSRLEGPLSLSRDAERVLNAVLRLYTGLFADFVIIREEQISHYLVMDMEVVYQSLLELKRRGLIDYRPRRKTPSITFLTPRLDISEVRIPRAIFEDRRERAMGRAEAMTDYLANDAECRLRQLLRYFGEEIREDCGRCDVCRRKAEVTGGNDVSPEGRMEEIHAMIADMRAQNPELTDEEVCLKAPHFSPGEIAEVLRRVKETER